MIRLELSAVELDVVWRASDFGTLPLVIDVPSPGATHAERLEIERRVWAELVDRGLADDHGQTHWRLHDRLETIARRGQSLELRVFGADATRATLATRGRRNVLAVLGDRFRIRSVPAVGRADTLLALLPEVPAGQGYSVSVDTDVFADAIMSTTPHDRLRRHGMSTDDARVLLAMATDSMRIAQIVAETRGVRSRAVSVHDTPSGRYQTIRTITASTDHLTVTPATTASIADAVTAR